MKSIPCTAAFLLTGLLLFPALGAAQDFVKLTDGKVVRGDILAVVDGDVEIVTPACELKTISGDEVADVRRGKGLSPRVVLRLKTIDARDPEALMKVAEWALQARGLKKDARRLLRRVVAFKPAGPRARELLGQVHALGTWYPDARAAYTAVRERMKADGYVYIKRGWIKKELASFLKASPKDWVLVRGFEWRSLAEIRKERGDRIWKKEWYSGEEAKLVKTLKRIEEVTGDDCHAAHVGTCKVFCYLGREESREAAERQQKARDWFVETFEVEKRRSYIKKHPLKVDFVLSGDEAFRRYLDDRKKKRSISQARYELCLRTGNTANGMFYCGHLGKQAWKYSLVSHMGLAMLRNFYAGGKCPAWIMVASGHHAELAIFGDVRVQWVHLGAYDQEIEVPKLEGHGMKQIKDAVREYYKDRPMPSLRVLSVKDMNELTQELATLGTVYMQFLLEEHKEKWLKFLTNKGAKRFNNVRERFEHHFQMTFEAMDQELRKWLGM